MRFREKAGQRSRGIERMTIKETGLLKELPTAKTSTQGPKLIVVLDYNPIIKHIHQVHTDVNK